MQFIEYDIMRCLIEAGNDPQYVDRLPIADDYSRIELSEAVSGMLCKCWLSGEVGGEIKLTATGMQEFFDDE